MPTEQEVYDKNINLQSKFYEYLNTKDKDLRQELMLLVKELHNHQWTNDQIYNILDVKSNCYNNCKYCYMKRLKNKFFHTDLENLEMIIDQKKISKNWAKSKKGKHIMFPSSHDIFDEYLTEYINTAMKMLQAGHTLLIVTKPKKSCIKEMIEQFKNYKDKIVFRLTLTSDNEKILQYYEPNASPFQKRLECLKLLFKNGYKTSVSIEPYLSDPTPLIEKIDPYITNDIWIGTMSGLNINEEIDDEHKEELDKYYSKSFIMSMIGTLKNNPKIFWKTSVMKVMLKR